MITAVDTNVLLDVLLPDPTFAAASQHQLDLALRQGGLLIGEVVYAELASRFPSQPALDGFLTDVHIRLELSRPPALHQAARAWQVYVAQRGRQIQCPRCGGRQTIACPNCGAPISPRQHILSDFMIGGHAVTQADRLLTRDLGYYRTYFAELTILSPT